MYKLLMIAVVFLIGLTSGTMLQASESQLGKTAVVTDKSSDVAYRGWRGGGYWGHRGFYGGYYPYGYNYNYYQPYYYNYPSGYYPSYYSGYSSYYYPYSSYYYNTSPGLSLYYGW